jgi:hypothetical protein
MLRRLKLRGAVPSLPTTRSWRTAPQQLYFILPKSKLYYDRRSVGRSILVSGTHLGGTDQFFFLLEIVFGQVLVCYFVAPFLMRGRFRNILLLLVLASAVPRDSRPYFIVPIIETPLTWRARSRYLYPPGHWVPFPSPLTTRRATVEVFYPASHGKKIFTLPLPYFA